jgi:branched-chain amino acid transport system substrate-binding protein
MPHLRTRALVMLSTGAVVVLAACGSSTSSSSSGGGSTGQPNYAPIPAGNIKLGFIAPLTGPNAQSGQFLKAGYSLFIADINAAGGIDGHQVDLVAGDDKADPATGASEARRLTQQEHVAAVLEPGTGETTFQILPVLTQAKTPTVAVLPENELDKPATYPYYFSVYPLNSDSAKEIVKYARTLGITKLGIARDTTGFGDSYEPVIRSEALLQNLTITDTKSFAISATDVTTQIRQLKDGGADGLVILSVGAAVGHVYEALKALNWAPKTVGTYSLLYSGRTSLGDLAANTFFSCGIGVANGGTPDPGLDALVQKSNTAFGKIPTNAGGIWSVDSIRILKAAIEKYHSLDPDAIKSAIESFKGVSYTSPNFTYTYSAQEHAGWPRSEVKMCRLDKVGQDGIPVFADNS